MNRLAGYRNWLSLLLCGMSVTSALGADEKPDARDVKVRNRAAAELPAMGKHWIGVHAVPVDEALKAQLGLPDRVIVHHVIPDSPAARAGLQEHDILLKFGDREISRPQDLVDAVADSGSKESSLLVLRGGKEKALTVQPAERPEEGDLDVLLPRMEVEDLHKLLGNLKAELNADGTFTWRAVGPGIVPHVHLNLAGKVAPFPDGLSLSVTKEKDQPARIVAKRGGQTYETTQDRLDVLPEEIRPLVERLLSGGKLVAFGLGRDAKDLPRVLAEAHEKAKADAAGQLRHRVEIRRLESTSIDQLRKDLEALRQEVQKLKSDRRSEKGERGEEDDSGALDEEAK